MAKKRPRKTRAEELVPSSKPATPAPTMDRLLDDIRTLIEQARQQVVRMVNSTMVAMYWSIGNRIREDILQEQRAEYGGQIVQTVSAQLAARVWSRIQPQQSFLHGPVRRGISGLPELSRRCLDN